MRKKWNCLCQRKNICSKQQKNTRADPVGKPQFHRHRTFRTTTDAQVNQEKLLVARNQRRYQEIHSRIYKVLVEQDTTYEES